MQAIPMSPEMLQRILGGEGGDDRPTIAHPLAQANEMRLRIETLDARRPDYRRRARLQVPGTLVVEDPLFRTHLAASGEMVFAVIRPLNLGREDDMVRLRDFYQKCDCMIEPPDVLVAWVSEGTMHVQPHSTLQLLPFVHEE